MSTLFSSYETADDLDHLSIKYTNLYSVNGNIYYFASENENLPFVNKWTDSYQWRPLIKIFENEEDIELFLNKNNIEELDFILFGDVLWYGNIAHGLFDGLYPLYLAMIKFGHIDDKFTLLSNDAINPPTLFYNVLKVFSNNDTHYCYNQCEGQYSHCYNWLDINKVYHFKTFISGAGNAGNRVMNEEYTLYGNKYDAIKLFKNRLLKNYNIEKKVINRENPKIIIIDNKRYSNYERIEINKVIEHFSNIGINIKYVDWSKYASFKDQMIEIEDVDIQIGGPGTGIDYMVFMKEGSVNINLGYMERTQTNYSRINIKIENPTKPDYIFPAYLEQYISQSIKWMSTLYYDRFKYNNIEYSPLIDIINEALMLIKNNIILENNLFIDALIFKEYCKRCSNPKQICKHLTDIAFCIELFINEHPKAISNITDIDLLRQIKDEFNFDRTYEIKL